MLENADLSQQIYVLRTKFGPDGAKAGADGSKLMTAEEERIENI